MLCNGSHDGCNRCFLERICADRRRGHLAANHNHRDRVGHAVAHRCNRVGGTRPGRHHYDANLAACSCIAGGHKPRALLVGWHDQLYGRFTVRYGMRVVVPEHRIVDWEDRAAAVAEHRIDTFIGQNLHHRVGS